MFFILFFRNNTYISFFFLLVQKVLEDHILKLYKPSTWRQLQHTKQSLARINEQVSKWGEMVEKHESQELIHLQNIWLDVLGL